MAELVGLEAVAAVCQQVIDEVPIGLLAVAHDQVRAALAELAEEVGSSRNPYYRQAFTALQAMAADIDAARVDLVAAAGHARAYHGVL